MGMFITIQLDKGCPQCGAKVEWQTKNLLLDDVYPVVNLLQEYDVSERMDADLYTYCVHCKNRTNLVMRKGEIVDK
jgi:hypothetical protein